MIAALEERARAERTITYAELAETQAETFHRLELNRLFVSYRQS